MAQDLRKSNFSLQRSATESRRFPTIAVTTPAEGSVDPDDIETSSNPEASQKLKRLSQAGLNPLKPVIIANTEFVPVGDGTSPDSTGLKVQLGDNNLLSVNSVTKLFEIHRQVRLATISAADVLLSRIKGFDTEKVLNILRKKIDESLEDLVKENLSQTVDAVIESIVAGNDRKGGLHQFKTSSKNAATKSNKAQASRSNKKRTKGPGANSESITPGAIKNISVSPKLGLDFTPIKRVFRENKEDPYLRTLVERVILEKITYDILKYMSGILSLKDAGLARWSIYESLDFSIGEKSFDDDVIEKMINLTIANHRAGAGFTVATDLSEVLKVYSGINTESSTPDVNLLIQFFISAGESFLRQEDILSEVIKGEISENLTVKKNPKYRGVPKVKKALDILSLGTRKSIYTNINAGSSSDDYFVPDHKNDDNSFNKRMIENLYDGWAPDISKIDIHGELLAASIFNDCIDIASKTTSGTKKVKAFYSLGQGIPSGITSVEDYFRELLEFDKDAKRSELIYKYKLNRRNRGGSRLVKYLAAKSSNSDELPDYIPFESTTNLTDKHRGPYLTGPEYFYDVAIQRGDERLTEFKAFAENYNDFATGYINDIYNMTKLDYAVPAAKKLLQKIGNELLTATEDGSLDIFLLALISYNARNTEGLLRLFSSIASAVRLDKVEDKEGGGVGDPGERAQDTQEGSRRAMRAANQILVKKFLYDAAKISHSLKDENSKSVLNANGDKMSTALYQKEYLEKDKRFSKVENGRTVITGTGEDNSKRVKYKIHKQSGKKYGTPNNGLNKEIRALEGGPNISFSGSTPCPSFKYFISNEHFEDAGLVSSEQRQNFNSNRQDKGSRSFHQIRGIDYQGTGVELATHHRLFLLYSFVAKIINKSARVYVKSFNASGGNNARIEVWMSAGEIEGIALAFKSAARGRTNQNFDSWAEDKKIAYANTAEHLERFLESLSRRISKSAAAVLGPALHGQQIYNQFVEASKFISQGDGTERSRLGISVLKDRKIRAFHNSLDLLTDESVAQIYKSYTTTLLSAGKSSYTQEDVPNTRQIKLMMKILTTPGYGLLTSEKRGPKNICHVGVTNALLNTLRYEAYKDFGDRRFLESRTFCVNIFKRNEVDSQVLVYPKTFLFDSSLMIIDNNHLGEDLNHIKNFSDTWNFNQIVDNIEFTQWVRTNLGDDPFANLSSSFEPVFKKGSSLKSRGGLQSSSLGKDVLINHIFDYAFKIYYRYALGIDLNENNFTLTPVRKRANEVKGGLTSNSSDIQKDYDNLINQTRLLYPAANVDQKLASELFRTIEIIAANPGYCLQDKLKKIIYPKKFDKILSILVNEKDFVLYNEAYNKEFLDVFKTEPSFSFTSRINRPETKRRPFLADPSVRKYIAECDESFPEIFSMYASITILPG